MHKSGALSLTIIAVMTAVLSAGKQALAIVPNVEVVTLFIIVFSSVFSIRQTVSATLLFVFIEIAIYGVGTWVVYYYLYWPALAVIAGIIIKRVCSLKLKTVLATVVATVMTAYFSVLTTGIDIIFQYVNGAAKTELLRLFTVYYLRGSIFYIVHIVSNTIVVGILFYPLYKVLDTFKTSCYGFTDNLRIKIQK